MKQKKKEKNIPPILTANKIDIEAAIQNHKLSTTRQM